MGESEAERHFHETWLGMVQPVEGLVVSTPVLVEAQCMARQPLHVQTRLLALCTPAGIADPEPEDLRVNDLGKLLSELLGHRADSFDISAAIPDNVSLYVDEGRQTIRPTMALRDAGAVDAARYAMLVWDLGGFSDGDGLPLDRPETVTGDWDYPPAAKFERLLRHTRVPIGLLTNRQVMRLVYAPSGEAMGSITFRLADMATVGGRPILDAFVMLLSANRFFGVAPERALPALLAQSRSWQANITNRLADQVFEALEVLLLGFETAAERDGDYALRDALTREGNHLFEGLLTVLLRIVFVLFAEDRGLMPTDEPTFARYLSLSALFAQLQEDHGNSPDLMGQRFGAWGRLLSMFRAVFLGVEHGALRMPARRGTLFDPHRFPFLEGWGPDGNAPIADAEERAGVCVPTIDDGTVRAVLDKLIMLNGQRLSYRTLDVEQIGSVYEALMGYHVVRVGSAAARLGPDGVWVEIDEVLRVQKTQRAAWFKNTVGLSSAQASKLAAATTAAKPKEAFEALAHSAASRCAAGRVVVQPGAERRRTSSHYTPRHLSAPIVHRTLEPLLQVLGQDAPSEQMLALKICDPAMGSGAFLVEACRFLAEHVVTAWTREGRIGDIASTFGDPLMHARRLVAQRCLYGVDKNAGAVELAKISLWLVTLAKDLPFTFVDHALRHGDSLVGLNLEQIRSFHWKLGEQQDFVSLELSGAMLEAVALRERIVELASQSGEDAHREKERLLADAQDALRRVRLIGDIVVGAFFSADTEAAREKERRRRLDLVRTWLLSGEPPSDELRGLQAAIRTELPIFHWMAEFPEVFMFERRDPLDNGRVDGAAFMDAFGGNMPFIGGRRIATVHGSRYASWLTEIFQSTGGTDYVAFFFLRASELLGRNGTMGFIATNSVAEGDTRQCGLRLLLAAGLTIYDASKNIPWPGEAAVIVSIVHLAKGTAKRGVGDITLDDRVVATINSRLRSGDEIGDAVELRANGGHAFVGCFLRGEGFVLSHEEARALVTAHPKEASVIRPYMVGDDLNNSHDHAASRSVITFWDMSLEEARRFPAALAVLEEKVRPGRERLKTTGADAPHRKFWWRFANTRVDLRRELASRARCLVTARVAKHCIFSLVPTTSVFSEQVVVFTFDQMSAFAIMQSRIHEAWVRRVSTTMGEGLRYSSSACFVNFAFPGAKPSEVLGSLETVGKSVYDLRASYTLGETVGLTTAYNRLKDPVCEEPRIIGLRRLHEAMDRAVLDAYGWSDIEVPPYCPTSDADKKDLTNFEDEVVDRLFVLNATRAGAENVASGGAKKTKVKQSAKTNKATAQASEALNEQRDRQLLLGKDEED